jgi:DUF1680 family protein
VLRTIAEVGGFAYSTSNDAVWVNLYGGNTLATTLGGKPLKLRQETKYPWEGRIEITIDECPASEFALKLRIPGWADAASIRVNGESDSAIALPGTYATLRRTWKQGDAVELDLRMSPQLMVANPLVEEARNQIAIQRGPIVYCLESTDLPPGVRVADVSIPINAALGARFDPNLLGGVTVIDTEGVVAPSADWDGKLYRPLTADNSRRIPLRFIPYFAWSNRGESEMSVWLPRD